MFDEQEVTIKIANRMQLELHFKPWVMGSSPISGETQCSSVGRAAAFMFQRFLSMAIFSDLDVLKNANWTTLVNFSNTFGK